MKLFLSSIVALSIVVSNVVYAREVQVFGVGNHESREVRCLARNIYHEAGAESYEGKLAVAQVTANRVEDGRFPKSFCAVVSQKGLIDNRYVCQFSWYCTYKRDQEPPNNENYRESLELAKRVIKDGLRLLALKDALYFHSTSIDPKWSKPVVTVIGNHIFYKDYKK